VEIGVTKGWFGGHGDSLGLSIHLYYNHYYKFSYC